MKKYLLIFLLTLFSSVLLAQNRQVSGVVRDETGYELPGVSIIVKGTTNGTVSDISGKFVIMANEGDILIFSFIGMKRQEMPIGKKSTLDIVLKADVEMLDEVVAVGYGSLSKRDITGSVAKVTSSDLEGQKASSVEQLLQGRVAGVNILGGSGSPGESMNIRIRGANSLLGNNSPLYVIDGMPIESNNLLAGDVTQGADISMNANILSFIDPNTIESIEVLKDASSTAIYGSKGANGVIIITTKKATSTVATIEVMSRTTLSSVEKYIEIEKPWEFAKNHLDYVRSMGQNYPTFNGSEYYGLYYPTPDEIKNNPDKYGVDWQKEIFRDAVTQENSVSIRGKSGVTDYSLSYSRLNDQGVLLETSYQRNSINANLNSSLFNERLSISSNLTITKANGSNKPSAGNIGFSDGVVLSALQYNNVFPVYDENGNYFNRNQNATTGTTEILNHPLAYIYETTNRTDITLLLLSFRATYKLSKDLTFTSTVNNRFSESTHEVYLPTSVAQGSSVHGMGGKSWNNVSYFLNENYLNYNKKIGTNHSLKAVLGYSYEQSKYKDLSVSASRFPLDDLAISDISSGEIQNTPKDNYVNSQLVSTYGRINYSLKDRYLLTFTGRADGSSKFGTNNKWAFFPSGALAWRVSQESFMSSTKKQISDLKLRASYGRSGSQAISPYQSLPRVSTVGYYYGSTFNTGFSYSDVKNANLKWETTDTWDIGMDLKLFDQRINVVVDLYKKETKDLLWVYQAARETGFNTGIVNLGHINNKGFELSVEAIPVKTNKFSWTTGVNYSQNRSKIIELTNPASSDDFLLGPAILGGKMFPNVFQEGQPVGMFYGWIEDGVIQTQEEADALKYELGANLPVPGELKFRDLSGPEGKPDGIVDNHDRTIIGNPNPKFTMNWNNNFKFKVWKLGFNFIFVNDFDIYNISGAQLNISAGNKVETRASNDRWTPFYPSNKYPKTYSRLSVNFMTDRYLEDGTYLRLKTLYLSRDFWLAKKTTWIKAVNVNFSVNNVFTLTNYTGYNPDVNSYNSSEKINWDNGALPSVRSFSLTVKATF